MPSINRMDDLQELDEAECWRLLGQSEFGRLAVSIAGKPDVFPVNYRVDGKSILVNTAAGLKLAASVLGTAVSFEVDALDDVRQCGWSVVVRGPAVEIEGSEERQAAEDQELIPWAGGPKDRYLRIVPDHVTGRRLPRDER